jgi:hypothetical protein
MSDVATVDVALLRKLASDAGLIGACGSSSEFVTG